MRTARQAQVALTRAKRDLIDLAWKMRTAVMQLSTAMASRGQFPVLEYIHDAQVGKPLMHVVGPGIVVAHTPGPGAIIATPRGLYEVYRLDASEPPGSATYMHPSNATLIASPHHYDFTIDLATLAADRWLIYGPQALAAIEEVSRSQAITLSK